MYTLKDFQRLTNFLQVPEWWDDSILSHIMKPRRGSLSLLFLYSVFYSENKWSVGNYAITITPATNAAGIPSSIPMNAPLTWNQ